MANLARLPTPSTCFESRRSSRPRGPACARLAVEAAVLVERGSTQQAVLHTRHGDPAENDLAIDEEMGRHSLGHAHGSSAAATLQPLAHPLPAQLKHALPAQLSMAHGAIAACTSELQQLEHQSRHAQAQTIAAVASSSAPALPNVFGRPSRRSTPLPGQPAGGAVDPPCMHPDGHLLQQHASAPTHQPLHLLLDSSEAADAAETEAGRHQPPPSHAPHSQQRRRRRLRPLKRPRGTDPPPQRPPSGMSHAVQVETASPCDAPGAANGHPCPVVQPTSLAVAAAAATAVEISQSTSRGAVARPPRKQQQKQQQREGSSQRPGQQAQPQPASSTAPDAASAAARESAAQMALNVQQRYLTYLITSASSWQQLAVVYQQHRGLMNHIHISALLVRLARLVGPQAKLGPSGAGSSWSSWHGQGQGGLAGYGRSVQGAHLTPALLLSRWQQGDLGEAHASSPYPDFSSLEAELHGQQQGAGVAVGDVGVASADLTEHSLRPVRPLWSPAQQQQPSPTLQSAEAAGSTTLGSNSSSSPSTLPSQTPFFSPTPNTHLSIAAPSSSQQPAPTAPSASGQSGLPQLPLPPPSNELISIAARRYPTQQRLAAAAAKDAVSCLQSMGMRELVGCLRSAVVLGVGADKQTVVMFMTRAFCLMGPGQGQKLRKRSGRKQTAKLKRKAAAAAAAAAYASLAAAPAVTAAAGGAAVTAQAPAAGAASGAYADAGVAAGTAQGLANLLWGVAASGMRGLRSDWAACYYAALLPQCGQLTGQGVAMVLSASARLQSIPPSDLRHELLEHLVSLAESGRCWAPDVSMVLWAMARLRTQPHPGLTERLLLATKHQLPSFTAQELAVTLWGLAKLRVAPPAGWCEAFTACVTHSILQEHQPPAERSRSNAQPGMGSSSSRPAGNNAGSGNSSGGSSAAPNGSSSSRSSSSSSRRTPTAGDTPGSPISSSRGADRAVDYGDPAHRRGCAKSLSITLYSMALLQLHPAEQWMAACLQYVARYSSSFTSQGLASVVYAVALLNYRPGDEWLSRCHRVILRSSQGLHPASCTMLHKAYGILHFTPSGELVPDPSLVLAPEGRRQGRKSARRTGPMLGSMAKEALEPYAPAVGGGVRVDL